MNYENFNWFCMHGLTQPLHVSMCNLSMVISSHPTDSTRSTLLNHSSLRHIVYLKGGNPRDTVREG